MRIKRANNKLDFYFLKSIVGLIVNNLILNIMFKKVSLFLVLSLLTSSCAGLISGSDQDIFITSSRGHQGVEVAVIDKSGASRNVKLPASVNVRRSQSPLIIKVKDSRCYEQSQRSVSSKWNTMMIVDVIWGVIGLTSTTVDMNSGAAYSYDDTVLVNTNKKSSCK